MSESVNRMSKRFQEILDSASAAKRYAHGTHRSRAPEETLAAIEPHFPTFGLTRIADVTGLDRIGIPVCMAVRPNSRSLSVSQGKGLNLMLARVSAAMEAIEHYHGEHVELEQVHATFRELSAEAYVCDPLRLPLRLHTAYHEDRPMSWVRGYDLMGQREIYVPHDFVHLRYLRYHDDLPVFVRSSNGLASGNHTLEAIIHAACEAIERDATLLWELQQAEPDEDQTVLVLESVDDPACRELIDRIERAGLVLHVWDQRSDIGLPSFGATIAETRDEALSRRGSFGGYGCHPSKEIALSRAITEAAQSRLTQIAGARDDMYRSSYELQERSRLYRQYWEKIRAESRPSVDYAALPSPATDSFVGDLEMIMTRLQQAGIDQLIVVDLSDPRFEIAVVKVIIPDLEFKLEGMKNRYGKRANGHLLRTLVGRHFFGDAA